MNKRQIQPVNVWSENGTVSVNSLFLKDFYNYHFDDGGGKVCYTLGDYTENYDRIYGTIDIPSSVVQQWGPSDDIIFQYVADTLGLTII